MPLFRRLALRCRALRDGVRLLTSRPTEPNTRQQPSLRLAVRAAAELAGRQDAAGARTQAEHALRLCKALAPRDVCDATQQAELQHVQGECLRATAIAGAYSAGWAAAHALFQCNTVLLGRVGPRFTVAEQNAACVSLTNALEACGRWQDATRLLGDAVAIVIARSDGSQRGEWESNCVASDEAQLCGALEDLLVRHTAATLLRRVPWAAALGMLLPSGPNPPNAVAPPDAPVPLPAALEVVIEMLSGQGELEAALHVWGVYALSFGISSDRIITSIVLGCLEAALCCRGTTNPPGDCERRALQALDVLLIEGTRSPSRRWLLLHVLRCCGGAHAEEYRCLFDQLVVPRERQNVAALLRMSHLWVLPLTVPAAGQHAQPAGCADGVGECALPRGDVHQLSFNGRRAWWAIGGDGAEDVALAAADGGLRAPHPPHAAFQVLRDLAPALLQHCEDPAWPQVAFLDSGLDPACLGVAVHQGLRLLCATSSSSGSSIGVEDEKGLVACRRWLRRVMEWCMEGTPGVAEGGADVQLRLTVLAQLASAGVRSWEGAGAEVLPAPAALWHFERDALLAAASRAFRCTRNRCTENEPSMTSAVQQAIAEFLAVGMVHDDLEQHGRANERRSLALNPLLAAALVPRLLSNERWLHSSAVSAWLVACVASMAAAASRRLGCPPPPPQQQQRTHIMSVLKMAGRRLAENNGPNGGAGRCDVVLPAHLKRNLLQLGIFECALSPTRLIGGHDKPSVDAVKDECAFVRVSPSSTRSTFVDDLVRRGCFDWLLPHQGAALPPTASKARALPAQAALLSNYLQFLCHPTSDPQLAVPILQLLTEFQIQLPGGHSTAPILELLPARSDTGSADLALVHTRIASAALRKSIPAPLVRAVLVSFGGAFSTADQQRLAQRSAAPLEPSRRDDQISNSELPAVSFAPPCVLAGSAAGPTAKLLRKKGRWRDALQLHARARALSPSSRDTASVTKHALLACWEAGALEQVSLLLEACGDEMAGVNFAALAMLLHSTAELRTAKAPIALGVKTAALVHSLLSPEARVGDGGHHEEQRAALLRVVGHFALHNAFLAEASEHALRLLGGGGAAPPISASGERASPTSDTQRRRKAEAAMKLRDLHAVIDGGRWADAFRILPHVLAREPPLRIARNALTAVHHSSPDGGTAGWEGAAAVFHYVNAWPNPNRGCLWRCARALSLAGRWEECFRICSEPLMMNDVGVYITAARALVEVRESSVDDARALQLLLHLHAHMRSRVASRSFPPAAYRTLSAAIVTMALREARIRMERGDGNGETNDVVADAASAEAPTCAPRTLCGEEVLASILADAGSKRPSAVVVDSTFRPLGVELHRHIGSPTEDSELPTSHSKRHHHHAPELKNPAKLISTRLDLLLAIAGGE